MSRKRRKKKQLLDRVKTKFSETVATLHNPASMASTKISQGLFSQAAVNHSERIGGFMKLKSFKLKSMLKTLVILCFLGGGSYYGYHAASNYFGSSSEPKRWYGSAPQTSNSNIWASNSSNREFNRDVGRKVANSDLGLGSIKKSASDFFGFGPKKKVTKKSSKAKLAKHKGKKDYKFAKNVKHLKKHKLAKKHSGKKYHKLTKHKKQSKKFAKKKQRRSNRFAQQ